MAADLPELLFDLARAALAHQERQIDDLRARTQGLLAATALIGSLLGSTAIERRGLEPSAAAALIALGLGVLATIDALLPRRTSFALDTRSVHRRFANGPDTLSTAHVELAVGLQRLYQRNEPILARMAWGLSGGTILLVAQISLWTWTLAVS